MKLKAFVCFLLLILPLFLSAEIRSSHVVLPEKPVQGETMEIRYVFEVTGAWRFLGHEETVEGFRFLAQDHSEKRLSRSVVQVTVSYLAKSLVAGTVDLPPVKVMTNKGLQLIPGGSLQVEPHPVYGEAWKTAREFLKQQGEDCKELEWRYFLGNNHAFCDTERNAFAWVGPSGVVAYGVDATLWDGKNNDLAGRMFNAYGAERFVTVPEGTVNPLLGDIAYAQDGEYCEGFPMAKYRGWDSTCVAGCGAVALAQVLRYYGPSVRPSGKGQLSMDGVPPISVDMHEIDWDNLKVNELMYLSAASVQTHLSPVNSSTSLFWFRHALVGNWGFSPECRYLQERPLEDIVKLVCADLDAGRPVILGGEGHTFVCDGYKDGFLHFNFGWKGHCNGWYRLPEGISLPECLTAIRPMRPEEDKSLEVTLKKAGTLAAAIPEDLCLQVTSLKVSGKLQGEDVALIRRMTTEGMLMDLDLSDARIVGNGILRSQPYTERDASGMTFTSQYRHSFFGDIPGTEEEWRIDTITDAQWKEMSLRGLTKGSDWSLIRDKDGVRIRYYTRADVIGTAMFADCENLLSLRLPKTLTAIEENAFWKCSCLEHLYLPKGIRNLSDKALIGTPPFLEVHSE